jgi:carbon monoxide dehydrogenase subunit G
MVFVVDGAKGTAQVVAASGTSRTYFAHMPTTLLFTCSKPVDEVIGVLGSMQRFGEVHPIIQRIEPCGDQDYLVHETVSFGPIPYSFTYPVVVYVDRDTASVRIEATIQRITRMKLDFKVEPDGAGSKITETVEIRSPLPIKGYLLKLVRTQHSQLFKNIGNL